MPDHHRLQISLRLKAARHLRGRRGEKGRAVPLPVEELAERQTLRDNDITKNRLEEIEQMKIEARPMELQKIAQALDMPLDWFVADVHAGDLTASVDLLRQALQQRLDGLEAEWDRRFAQLERDRQKTLADLARLSAVQASEQLDSGSLPSTEPAPSTASTREGSGRTR